MIRLLHGGDFHLDSPFSGLPPELASLRRKEQRLALKQLEPLCREVDLVLLSGDLFDGNRVYRETIDALRELFSSTSAQFFISPGNHDFLGENSPYLSENWGENVHIFTSSAIERIPLAQWNCDVYGAGFTGAEMPPLLSNFRVENPSALNLMVVHGELQPNSLYNGIAPETVEASGLDYLALGHIHQGGKVKIGNTLCAWPGCLMGRGFDECGQKGVYLVQGDKNRLTTEFVPILTRKYEILSVPVGGNPEAAIAAALPENCQNDCYRILLTGESSPVDVGALEREFAPGFFALSLRDHTTPPVSLWKGAGEDSLRGHFLADLKAQYLEAEEEQKRKIVLAAKLVTSLMDGREVLL